jgi:hypothetical protein
MQTQSHRPAFRARPLPEGVVILSTAKDLWCFCKAGLKTRWTLGAPGLVFETWESTIQELSTVIPTERSERRNLQLLQGASHHAGCSTCLAFGHPRKARSSPNDRYLKIFFSAIPPLCLISFLKAFVNFD